MTATAAPGLPWMAAAAALLREVAETQAEAIETASQWSAEAIAADGLVHLFGTGHSRIPVEEMFPRYGSYPGFNPIVELSMTFHTQVVGANGQRQAMFIERMPGLAEVILSNFSFGPKDVMMVFSAGGTTAVPVEMARGARRRGVRVVAVPVPPDAAGVALQAPATIAITARATRPRAKPSRFMDFHSSLRRPRCPSWVAGRTIIAGSRVACRSVTHLLVGRSHGRAAAHALDRPHRTGPGTDRRPPRFRG